jgi:hypothetical protein
MRRWFREWWFILVIEGWPVIAGPLVGEYCMLLRHVGWVWYWHLLVDVGAVLVLFVINDLTAYLADDDGEWEMSFIFDWPARRRHKKQQALRGYSAD